MKRFNSRFCAGLAAFLCGLSLRAGQAGYRLTVDCPVAIFH
jgi:hypothetical protein